MKKILSFLFVFCVTMCIAAEVTITKVQQRYPWNGLVDIEYSVSEKSNCSLGLKIVDNYTGKGYKGRTFDKVPPTTVGLHKITWNSIADGVKLNSDNVEVFFEEIDPLYIVVDLSGGTSAASYRVTMLSDVPAGGWTDEYKTTKLVLRKITAGKMPRTDVDITLTKDYYIAIFELTQKQWELVMGSNPSNFDGDTLPVDNVTYNNIRGSSNGSQWPASNAVDATSFMGKLRAKTGIDFDLPTEAQWEYACRAGSLGDYGLLADGTMGTIDAMGWYGYGQTHVVGTKTPNAWGLYDMHGNVCERCLDWYSSSGYSGTDPVGATSGYYGRVMRGGAWGANAEYCTATNRSWEYPDTGQYYGFRVAAPAGL